MQWLIKEMLKFLTTNTLPKNCKSQFIEMFGDPIKNTKNFQTQQLKLIAPEYSCWLGDKEKYWLLNLDMIESESGQIIKKIYVSKKDIGSSTTTFDNTTVLYSKLRPYLNKVVIPDESGYATTELVVLKPNPDILNKEYLAALLRSDEFVSYAKSLSDGSRMPRFPMDKLRKFNVILPSIDLQNKFAEFVKLIDKSKFITEILLKFIKNMLNFHKN